MSPGEDTKVGCGGEGWDERRRGGPAPSERGEPGHWKVWKSEHEPLELTAMHEELLAHQPHDDSTMHEPQVG